jgi:hypothetical protein
MKLAKLALAAFFASAIFSPVAAADAIPGDWIEVMAGPMFTVHAPPGTSFERVRTGDAFAGTFHGPGFELTVEFGYHREDLKTPDSVKNAAMQKFVFDDKPGTIITATSADAARPRFVGLHVPNVENDAFGPLSLVITGNVAKAEDETTVKRIYETVTFGYKN